MGEVLSTSRDINAAPAKVWSLVTDLTRMGEWSPEATGGSWTGGATGPALGAKFKGNNANGSKNWSTQVTISEFEVDRLFSFDVKAAGMKIARWSYRIEPTEAGCRVTETWTDQRNAILPFLGKIASGVEDRSPHNLAGMETTLANLAVAAETAP